MVADAGQILPRFKWVDQYGDEVDIYDFAYQGQFMVFDLSGMWCSWCRKMAEWLSGNDGLMEEVHPAYDESWDVIPGLVRDGTIRWITILDSDDRLRETPKDTAAIEWHEAFPHDQIPVLIDYTLQMDQFLDWGGYPRMMLVEEDMTIYLTGMPYVTAFRILLERLGYLNPTAPF